MALGPAARKNVLGQVQYELVNDALITQKHTDILLNIRKGETELLYIWRRGSGMKKVKNCCIKE